MTHNLMQRNGKYAMASARGVAVWHELGQRVGETATWREMAEAADLLWSIIVKDVFARASPSILELAAAQPVSTGRR